MAVIGGGNSGVEAAIDLAGVVAHVTLIEFADQLKADAVLVNKLKSLPNVDDPHQRADHRDHRRRPEGQRPALQGPRQRRRARASTWPACSCRSAWCPTPTGSRARWSCRKYGEIIIDAKCATSLPGVFAAGDVTTVPYKQIIIATGEGSKAALSAFDHLIRTPV